MEKVICANEKFVDAHVMPILMPGEQFKCYVCLSLERDEVSQDTEECGRLRC